MRSTRDRTRRPRCELRPPGQRGGHVDPHRMATTGQGGGGRRPASPHLRPARRHGQPACPRPAPRRLRSRRRARSRQREQPGVPARVLRLREDRRGVCARQPRVGPGRGRVRAGALPSPGRRRREPAGATGGARARARRGARGGRGVRCAGHRSGVGARAGRDVAGPRGARYASRRQRAAVPGRGPRPTELPLHERDDLSTEGSRQQPRGGVHRVAQRPARPRVSPRAIARW